MVYRLYIEKREGLENEARAAYAELSGDASYMEIAKQYAQQEDMQPWLRSAPALVADLMRCEIPYCTPAGKPTMLPYTANEINRKFQAQ